MTEGDDKRALEPQALAEQVAAAMVRDDAAARFLGIRIEAVGPGACRASMKVREELLNSFRIGHGGFIFALADTAFAYACNAYNLATVASGCCIDYLGPARLGDTLTAAAEERSLSGRTGVYDITVTNQAGETIALFRGRSYRIKGASTSPGVPNPRPLPPRSGEGVT